MPKNLVTSSGTQIQLGRELGKGGEGSVFEVLAFPNMVAKVYHQPPDIKKQKKLTFMAGNTDQHLLSYVAWPQETLHASRGGPVAGFLMQKVAGRDQIHMIYSPKHRMQEKPKSGWDFLLFVARNTAAAFEAVHNQGHVLGDVNHGNVMVGSDSKVIIIDSDSCQVNASGTLHLCEVGVGHFTPPELQGISSFSSTTRTLNHDNFGLALLIFHVLIGGRHPYAGVPLKNGVGDSLEADIKAYRYAFAHDASSRHIKPPPFSIPIGLVPDKIQAMFHQAFTENGAISRPTAKEWVAVLDDLRDRLKKCIASPAHIYPNHLSKCPWCELEQHGIIYFIDVGAGYSYTTSGFALVKVWAIIEAEPAPPQIKVPNLNHLNITPRPLPSNVPGQMTIGFYRLLAVLFGSAIVFGASQVWLLGVLVGIVGWVVAGSVGDSERKTEHKRRKEAKDAAQIVYDRLIERIKKEVGPEGFLAKRTELSKLRDEYQILPQREKQELEKLHSTAQERQKQKFLDGFFIDSASIPGVGPARKIALRSFGIETAADVTRGRVSQVRGFGISLTSAVMDWKASCERKFTFNPNTAVSESDRNAVRSKILARRTAIEAALNGGASELRRFRQTAISRQASLQSQLEQAAQQLAQAEKDLTLL